MSPHFARSRTAIAGMGMLALICLTRVTGLGADASYFENFDNSPEGRPVDFVETPDGNWNIYPDSKPGTAHYNGGLYASGTSPVISSAVSLANVPGHDFTVRANVSVSGMFDTRLMDLALVVLGSDSDFTSSGYRLRYWVSAAYDRWGDLWLQRAEEPYLTTVSDRPSLPPPFGPHAYTITLSGRYANGALYLTGTLSDGLRTISASLTDPAPLTGTNFGFRQQVTASSFHPGGFGADWDNFSVMLLDSPGGDLNEGPVLRKTGD